MMTGPGGPDGASAFDALDRKRLLPAIVLAGDAQQGIRGVVLPPARIAGGAGTGAERA